MDAEGLGRKLLLKPPAILREPEKRTVGLWPVGVSRGNTIRGNRSHRLWLQSPYGRKTGFCARTNFEGLWWAFSGGAWKLLSQLSKVWCSRWESLTIKVYLRLQQSFLTSGAHKGLPLRVSMLLPEECFGGRFPVCLECIIFQGFRLRAALKATLRADLRADTKGGH